MAFRCELVCYIFPKNCHKFLLTRTMVFGKITAFKLADIIVIIVISLLFILLDYSKCCELAHRVIISYMNLDEK